MSARDGSFTFEDVPAGVYLVEVLSTTWHYSAVKVKVDDTTGIVALEYKVSRSFLVTCDYGGGHVQQSELMTDPKTTCQYPLRLHPVCGSGCSC